MQYYVYQSRYLASFRHSRAYSCSNVALCNAELCYRRCNMEDFAAVRPNPKTHKVKTVLF